MAEKENEKRAQVKKAAQDSIGIDVADKKYFIYLIFSFYYGLEGRA